MKKILVKLRARVNARGGKWSKYEFCLRAFCFLHENSELMQNADYERLYYELWLYLYNEFVQKCGWKPNDIDDAAGVYAFCEEKNEAITDKFDKAIVDDYLATRKKIWGAWRDRGNLV